MKIKIISVVLATLLGLLGYRFFNFNLSKKEIKNITIGQKEISAEFVLIPEKQQKGLSERNELCDNCAMLFIFPEKTTHNFWMKDMRFDLDILWIADGKVIYIIKNADHNSLKILDPPQLSDMVLEVEAGFCDKYGVSLGDKIGLK